MRREGQEREKKGEEAGEHGVFLSQMRSDLSLPLARALGRARRSSPSVPRSSTLAARCWYSKTLSGDERHYPHLAQVDQEGRTRAAILA